MSEPVGEAPPPVSYDENEEELTQEKTVDGENDTDKQEDESQSVDQLLDVDLNQLLNYHISFDNLTHVLNSLIKVAKNQDDDIKKRNKENEELRKEVDGLKATVSTNDSKLNDHDSRLSRCEEGQAALSEQVNKVDTDSLQERVESIESQMAELSKSNEGEKEGSGDNIKDLSKRVGDLEERIGNLRSDQSTNTLCDENLQRINSLEERLDGVQKSNEESAQKVVALQSDVDKLPSSDSLAAMLDGHSNSGDNQAGEDRAVSGGRTDASTLMKLNQLEKSVSRMEQDYNKCATKNELQAVKDSIPRSSVKKGEDESSDIDLRSLQEQVRKHQREIERLEEAIQALDSSNLEPSVEEKAIPQGDEEDQDRSGVSSQEIQALRRELSRGIKSMNTKINEVDEAFREEDQNLRESLSKRISKNAELLEEIPAKLAELNGAIWQLRGENDEFREPLSSLAKSAGVLAGVSREELDSIQKSTIEKYRNSMGSRAEQGSTRHADAEESKEMKNDERDAHVFPEIYGFKQLVLELARGATPKVNSDDIRTLRAQVGSMEDQLRSRNRNDRSQETDESGQQRRQGSGLQEAEVNERLSLCEEDMERHRRAIQKLRHDVKGLRSGLDEKVDKADYDQLSKSVETKAEDDDLMALTKTLQDYIQRRPRRKQQSESKHDQQSIWESENAAAANKRLIPGYKCLVCDRPLQDFKHTEPKYVPRDSLPRYQKDADFSFERFHRPVTAASSTNRSLHSSHRRPQSAGRPSSPDPRMDDPYNQERAVGGKHTHEDVKSPELKRLPNGQVIRRNSVTDETHSRPSSTRESKRSQAGSPRRSPSIEAASPRQNGELPEIS
eukprot:gb/GECG01000031.1/.p1 GENE.gb/GECG01000031.1/~~gb/GECG01000031.1/.p1  ORF type:complete len:843 (+),score=172.27 gb/GECG01000031.1/:1-2529(+)